MIEHDPKKVEQVLTWILEGNSENSIVETVGKEWPDEEPFGLMEAAIRELARRADAPQKEADDWCLGAAKLIHQKQMELGDFGAALRTVQHIEKLTARLKEERNPPCQTTLLADPSHHAQDLRLVRRAINNGWNIPQHILDTLPSEVLNILTTAKDSRVKMAAISALISMHGQNIKAKPPVKKVKHTHELGPITDANIEDHRKRLLNRLGADGTDTRGTPAG